MEPLGSEWSSEAILWFQSLVDGEQLSARILSVTPQGYGVELESRGQNLTVSLLSECLAKSPGPNQETHVTTGSGPKCQQSVKENKHSQIQLQAFIHTGATSKEIPIETQGGSSPEGQLGRQCLQDDMVCFKSVILKSWTRVSVPCFPVDWKTEELPLSKTFQAYFAAVTSPSLFYLPNSSQGQCFAPACHENLHK